MKRLSTPVVITLACLSISAALAQADIIYNVGPGQTYATIQAALNAIPDAPFTTSHVVNIHADVPGGSYVYNITGVNALQTNWNNTRVNLPTETNRLVVQANPGDDVSLNFQNGAWNYRFEIRDPNVTVQGLRFTGKTAVASVAEAYLGLGQYSPGSVLRSGYLIYNNEFIGGGGPAHSQNVGDPSATWQVAFVNNNFHDTDFHTALEKIDLFAGNVFYDQNPTLGGGGIVSLNPNGHAVNNTLINAGSGIRQNNPIDSGVVANNLIVGMSTRAFYYGASYTITENLFPTMSNNLGYGNLRWASHGGGHHSPTLAIWNTNLANGGKDLEVNSLDGLDPLFFDAMNKDFRLDELSGSPAVGAADPLAWGNAIGSIAGMEALLAAYWNPIRDIGYDMTRLNIGALSSVIPEPTSGLLLALAGLAGLRRRRD